MHLFIGISRRDSEEEAPGIVLHLINDARGIRVHLATETPKGIQHIQTANGYVPSQMGGLTQCSPPSRPDGWVMLKDGRLRYARTFFRGCAGHWTAFRRLLRLTEEQVPLYRTIHEQVMRVITDRERDVMLALHIQKHLAGTPLRAYVLVD